MTRRLIAAVITLTRWWLHAYTSYAPAVLADARRSEWVVAEGADVAVASQPTIGAPPRGPPAEPRKPVTLQPFRERP